MKSFLNLSNSNVLCLERVLYEVIRKSILLFLSLSRKQLLKNIFRVGQFPIHQVNRFIDKIEQKQKSWAQPCL